MAVGGVAAYLQPQRPTFVHRLSKFQSAVEMAFSMRELAEEADFKAVWSLLLNEDGQAEPGAMSLKSVIRQTEDQEKPSLKITFAAKEGKTDDLVTQLKQIKNMSVAMEKEDKGENAADAMNQAITIEAAGEKDVEGRLQGPDAHVHARAQHGPRFG